MPYFNALQYFINNLETQRSYKTRDNIGNLKFLKKIHPANKIICLFVKVDQNIYKNR